MTEYVTKDGDHATIKGFTLTVEFGEKTRNEILSKVDKVKTENERLRRALAESCCRLSAANEAAGGGFVDDGYCELLRELGIEVDHELD